jgi:Uma2 family endonuclease
MTQMLGKPRRRIVTIGPEDDGRQMSLDLFDRAVGTEGYSYELNKGVIEVSDAPHPNHFAVLQEIRDQLVMYKRTTPGFIHSIAGSNDCKVLVDTAQSERHPDLSFYLTPPPDTKDVWSEWVPAVVVEVVSKSSSKRDYGDKPPEYAAFGIDEYWIVDPLENRMTVMTRWRGTWKPRTLKPSSKYSTPLLPGFVLDLKLVLDAKK